MRVPRCHPDLLNQKLGLLLVCTGLPGNSGARSVLRTAALAHHAPDSSSAALQTCQGLVLQERESAAFQNHVPAVLLGSQVWLRLEANSDCLRLWFLYRLRGVQPTACVQPTVARNVTQHKIVSLLKTLFFAHQFLLVFVYLLCGPETPKGWTPLELQMILLLRVLFLFFLFLSYKQRSI